MEPVTTAALVGGGATVASSIADAFTGGKNKGKAPQAISPVPSPAISKVGASTGTAPLPSNVQPLPTRKEYAMEALKQGYA